MPGVFSPPGILGAQMLETIFLEGRMPGRNEQEYAARVHRLSAAKMKKQYTSHVRRILMPLGLRFEKVSVSCLWIEPNKRRDPDNIAAAIKYVIDGMVEAKVIENDGWKQVEAIRHTFEVGDPVGVWLQLVGPEAKKN